MRNNIVLIDYENVQPAALDQLSQDNFRALIFVGERQAKVPFELATAAQRLGDRAEYIKISGNGPNALDFHIAYYIGKLSEADPAAYFHIVSKDTGFDPLVTHLKKRKIFAGRVEDITAIPVIKLLNKKTPAERIEFVLEKLRQPTFTKPRTVKTLSSSIASVFHKRLSDKEIDAVVAGLVERSSISIDGTKVTYLSTGDVP